jgi:5-methylcytosine-specific restriction protein B
VSSVEDFRARFRYEILPLLQEYAYEDYKELESYLGPKLVSATEQALQTDVLDDAQRLVDALTSEFQPMKELVETELVPPEAVLAAASDGV